MEDTDSGVVAPPRTKEELLSRARQYARTVDLAVDIGAIDWECSERAKRRAGACRYDGETERVTIRLTWDAYEAHGWAQFRETIRHELIHAWEFQRFGESSHGARFERKADDLDVDVHCEAFTEPRLRASCTAEGCDWELRRHRAINDLVDDGVLEEVTGKGRNKEYRAREIFEILEQPPQIYRRSRPSASGLDPEGEGRKPR